VAIGTAHFADPKVASRISKRLPKLVERTGASSVVELIGGMQPW